MLYAYVRKANLPIPPAGSGLLDARQVAALLGVSEKTVRRMRDAGKLPPTVKVGVSKTLVRWRRADIERFIAGL